VVLQGAAVAPPGAMRVDRDSIAAAMRQEQGNTSRVNTNQSRLQTRVLLRLARSAHLAHPEGTVLFIDFEDWFQAYLSALELRADQAPLSVRLTHEHQYDILVDAQAGTVVQRVKQGPPPRLALTVVWRSRNGPDGYSYRDTRSRPVVEMTYQRTVSYRLLDFGDAVVQDQFGGISGRPATGALSLLFRSHRTGPARVVTVGRGNGRMAGHRGEGTQRSVRPDHHGDGAAGRPCRARSSR
jgi:hypothetical protein